MKKSSVFISASLLGAVPAVAAVYQQWAVGQEREVDEGIYFKLALVKDGWRLWRIETEHEIDCRAVKSAIGKRNSFPLGVQRAFYNGSETAPFITFMKDFKGDIRYSWSGLDVENDQVQSRKPGERFWTVDKGQQPLADGEKLEVSITSWEYPAIHVGYHNAKGVMDLTGLDAMIAEIGRCSKRKVQD